MELFLFWGSFLDDVFSKAFRESRGVTGYSKGDGNTLFICNFVQLHNHLGKGFQIGAANFQGLIHENIGGVVVGGIQAGDKDP